MGTATATATATGQTCEYHPGIEADYRCSLCSTPLCSQCHHGKRSNGPLCPDCAKGAALANGAGGLDAFVTRKASAQGSCPSRRNSRKDFSRSCIWITGSQRTRRCAGSAIRIPFAHPRTSRRFPKRPK